MGPAFPSEYTHRTPQARRPPAARDVRDDQVDRARYARLRTGIR